MNLRHKRTIVAIFAGALFLGASQAQTPQAEAPKINGNWTGTWWIYSPAKGTVPPQNICKPLIAKVERNDNVWLANFEGDCGRPYKYEII